MHTSQSEDTARSSSRKQGQIVDQIVVLARKYGAGMKLPTVRELAKTFGVTVSTVDRSLGRLEEMGIVHRKRGSGIYVSSRIAQKCIGLIFGRNIFSAGSSPFYRLLLEHCEHRAQQQNEAFSFYLDTPQLGRDDAVDIHQDLTDALARGRLDGILVANKRNPEQDKLLRSYGLPMVVLSENTSGFGLVNFDVEDFLEQSVAQLSKQGCKTIGLLGTLRRHGEVLERVAKGAGVSIVSEWVQCLPGPNKVSPDNYESAGRSLFKSTFEANRRLLPDGLILTDDILTRGACAEMENSGIIVGQDVKCIVQSNKDSDVLRDWEAKLSMIEMDSVKIVEAMFTELEALMQNPNEPRPPVLIKGRLK